MDIKDYVTLPLDAKLIIGGLTTNFSARKIIIAIVDHFIFIFSMLFACCTALL
jgi:hypothetical protein